MQAGRAQEGLRALDYRLRRAGCCQQDWHHQGQPASSACGTWSSVAQRGRAAMVAKEAEKKAKKAAKALAQGSNLKKSVKVRTKTKFHRPKTLRLLRNPKYSRRSVPRVDKLDQYTILKYPLTTESAMKKIEDNNTLVFIVDTRANKRQITEAVRRMYEIKTAKVNTLIRPDGLKKAYVRLTTDYDALDVANKIGII
eukprot:CAMPEP_0195589130 /NCGR_PEP_ID=MMETSP0814-20130614/33479_1 /TAXON_ID=97485 /ORGANISM="Prymnesium parvum, Strain Texoma1" /LENGTH=196 /DNA_ID=CAMNT_0040728153 /DNA_START=258 /DNA_END=849 /DNA_ORIENTATION=+